MADTPAPEVEKAIQAIREALDAGATPGPWTAEIKGGPWVDAAYVRAPNWGVVARVGLSYSLPHWDGPQRANAALIAACNPEVMAALLSLLASMDAEIARLRADAERTACSRDMWKGQCERQAETLTSLRELINDHNADCVQQCEARKTAGPTQCPYSAYGRQCPDCPRDGMVDAALAAQAKGGE